MAGDDGSKREGVPSAVAAWLVFALAIVTGYAAWQMMPLEGRIEALERQNLATRDRMLAEIERLNFEVAALRGTPAGEGAASAPATAPSPVSRQAAAAPQSPAPAAATPAAVDPTAFINARLLPADAAIARAMVAGTPPEDIARQTQHSQAFVLARGAQITKLISAAPGAPPELLRALQDYLRGHRP
jgi:hypothetical protein